MENFQPSSEPGSVNQILQTILEFLRRRIYVRTRNDPGSPFFPGKVINAELTGLDQKAVLECMPIAELFEARRGEDSSRQTARAENILAGPCSRLENDPL